MSDAAARSPGRGDTLAGRYVLQERIAAGGMAAVWRATDTVLEREVAVKILHAHLAADDTFVARFRTEAVAAARLRHANIVSIYDTCSTDGVEAIVMELVRGRNLRAYLDEHGPLHPAEAVHIVAEVADALAAAHRAGLVHRDIKPANILIRDDGQVLVTDFGIAKLRSQTADLTQTGMMIGSVRYLSPEQVEGKPVDARTDVYALGIVLYEALTGRAPFQADTDAATALARLREYPMRPRQIRPGIPKGLEAVVLRAMAIDPNQRYSSAVEMRAALLATPTSDDPTGAEVQQPTGIVPAPTPPAPRPAPRPQESFARSERNWLIPMLLIVLVATALGIAGVLFGRTDAGQELFDKAREAVGGDGSADSGAAETPDDALAVATVADFDPFGTGTPGENTDQVGNVVDGDAATTWRTEGYSTNALGGGKPGVGLLVELEEPGEVDELVVRSPTQGWAAEVYVAGDRTVWEGEAGLVDPVASASDIRGDALFDLGGIEGGYVLLWITDLGEPTVPCDANCFHVTVSEVSVS